MNYPLLIQSIRTVQFHSLHKLPTVSPKKMLSPHATVSYSPHTRNPAFALIRRRTANNGSYGGLSVACFSETAVRK